MKDTRSKHSVDTRFNVENSSKAKGKNHRRQPANTLHYYQELGYNVVRRLTTSYIRWNPNLSICTVPSEVGLYNVQLNLEHIQHQLHLCHAVALIGLRQTLPYYIGAIFFM